MRKKPSNPRIKSTPTVDIDSDLKAGYKSEEDLQRIIGKAIDLHKHYHQDDLYNQVAPVDKVSIFNSEFTKKKIKNEDVKDIISSAFNYFPDCEITQEELFLLQNAIRTKYRDDNLCQGVVDSFVDYVIGSGVTVNSPVKEVNDVLCDFRNMNKMALRERNITKDIFLDGEYFCLIYTDKSGNCFLRKAAPSMITSIETSRRDIEAVLSFKKDAVEYDSEGNPSGVPFTQYIKNIDYDKLIKMTDLGYIPSVYSSKLEKNVVCKFFKLSEEGVLRGRPPLRNFPKYAKLYENFIMDRMVLNHERSKVVWIKKLKGRTSEETSSTAPRGGMMLVERDGIEYRIESSKLDSAEAKEDALHILYYLGSGIRYPLHILNQRTSEEVYASIRKSDTPFSTMITGYQWYEALEFQEIYKYTIEQKVKAKKLKKQYTYPAYSEESVMFALLKVTELIEDDVNRPTEEILNVVDGILKSDGLKDITKNTLEIPISQDFPQIIWQDPKEMAEVLKIHKEIGIASIPSLAAKAGYNWEREFSKIIITQKQLLKNNIIPDPNPPKETGTEKPNGNKTSKPVNKK